MLPSKFLRETIFYVVVIWGATAVLAGIMFNVYLLTSEEWFFINLVRMKTLINFIDFSANIFLTAFLFLLGYKLGATRVQKRKSKSTKIFLRGVS